MILIQRTLCCILTGGTENIARETEFPYMKYINVIVSMTLFKSSSYSVPSNQITWETPKLVDYSGSLESPSDATLAHVSVPCVAQSKCDFVCICASGNRKDCSSIRDLGTQVPQAIRDRPPFGSRPSKSKSLISPRGWIDSSKARKILQARTRNGQNFHSCDLYCLCSGDRVIETLEGIPSLETTLEYPTEGAQNLSSPLKSSGVWPHNFSSTSARTRYASGINMEFWIT